MRFLKQERQYLPLTLVTIALAISVVFLGKNGTYPDPRRGDAGMAIDANSAYGVGRADERARVDAAGDLPFYGFDGIDLHQSQSFHSWWQGAVSSEKLQELSANTVVVGSVWNNVLKFEDTVSRLHAKGIRAIIQVTDVHDWLEGRANEVIQQARNQGVGYLADYIIIEGDSARYSSQRQRQMMYRTIKEYFPNVPLVRRYGASIEAAENMHGKPHPRGGTWDEYRFGPNECDVALLEISEIDRPDVLDRIGHMVALVKSQQHETSVVISAELARGGELRKSKFAMPAPEELSRFLMGVLTVPEVEGLLLKGMGKYQYDLGHPGFSRQRQIFKRASPTAPLRILNNVHRSIASDLLRGVK